MQLTEQQGFNEALIKLSVLLYQVDGKVSLSEQDYLDHVIDELDWGSTISKSAFLTDAIFRAREAVDNDDCQGFIRKLSDDLNQNANKTLEVAMTLTGIDGERSEREVELLAFLTNRVLAKSLMAQVEEFDSATPIS
ncbi:MAG: TerB family tellurite resistance protein [Paraglaciecola sp.]|uniref:TerB family tellurite resistance protein n=1 Tax=Pseudomonadati TaxID=3379134 RepID=UPI00273DAC27|nr:TerB family tellurite resistance protein [Paraglaciecola sp.]MDP5032099.1 TerB family tellurite resistance protein [Paraglaciecola sp.]MDP5133486.1 TerB family tellurite resistance protein [Paraglaciecola sp.]